MANAHPKNKPSNLLIGGEDALAMKVEKQKRKRANKPRCNMEIIGRIHLLIKSPTTLEFQAGKVY
jgi:hypothetical protein